MTILLVGLNNQTTPLALRERLHLAGDTLYQALRTLHGDLMAEVVIVSTCNRLEIYATTPDPDQAAACIRALLAERAALPDDALQISTDQDAVRHLMRVASGLESLVIGESEILGQIVDALEIAQQTGTTGAVLSRVFHMAIHTGKRARTETAIGKHTLSVSHAAVLMAQQHIADLSTAKAIILGAGRMAELAVRALQSHGASQITLINRTYERAASLAERIGVSALPWDSLPASLAEADIIITATGANQPVLSAADMPAARVIVVDIAVPRNVHDDVRALPHISLYDIDELRAVVEDHRAKRQSEVIAVEAIIDDELNACVGWLNSRVAASTIVALRQKAEALAEAELIRALNRLPDASDHEREVVEQMAHRIVNKLLHAPISALREQSAGVDAARRLFDLEIHAD